MCRVAHKKNTHFTQKKKHVAQAKKVDELASILLERLQCDSHLKIWFEEATDKTTRWHASLQRFFFSCFNSPNSNEVRDCVYMCMSIVKAMVIAFNLNIRVFKVCKKMGPTKCEQRANDWNFAIGLNIFKFDLYFWSIALINRRLFRLSIDWQRTQYSSNHCVMSRVRVHMLILMLILMLMCSKRYAKCTMPFCDSIFSKLYFSIGLFYKQHTFLHTKHVIAITGQRKKHGPKITMRQTSFRNSSIFESIFESKTNFFFLGDLMFSMMFRWCFAWNIHNATQLFRRMQSTRFSAILNLTQAFCCY